MAENVWDDSALIDSWNEALAEYEKYHSIHALRGNIDEHLSAQKQQHANPEIKQLDRVGSAPPAMEDAAVDGQDTPPIADLNQHRVDSAISEGDEHTKGTREDGGGASVMPSPEALLGTVRDDGLKKLLMSWYYAGFYTGFNEGQQQRQSR